MTAFAPTIPVENLPFQPEKRFSSGDRIVIVTDILIYSSAYYEFSTPQQWFRVGAIDLITNRLGYFRFSIDDARAMIKAKVPRPPWVQSLPIGIELVRVAHKQRGAGRFPERVTLVDVEPQILAFSPFARKKFDADCHRPNATPGMWQVMVSRIMLEERIESAAFSMAQEFSAGDIKKVVGRDVNVTPVLQRLVKERRLVQTGKKRGVRYCVAPPVIPERLDWTG